MARATLVTASFGGGAADQTLAEAPEAERRQLAEAIGAFVTRLHRSGFRDRNLDLRNLLIRRDGDQLTIAKIDSPRHRIVAGNHTGDRLAEADWQRLLPQLAEYGVADVAVAAKRKG